MAKPFLKQKYEQEIKKELIQELGIKNPMSVPGLVKIVVNAGVGKEFTANSNVAEEYAQDLSLITGQKPVVTKSKKAVSNFKLREGTDNGLKVTLRGDRMWEFLYKLTNVVLPRVKDFRGLSDKSFDKRGNYALGIKEHTVFPEIDTSKLVKIRTLQVIICTSAQNDADAKLLLQKLGVPFNKHN